MKTITMPNFKSRAVNIIEEIRTRTCIDELDAEVVKEILQDALEEYYHNDYNDGYYEGHDAGYALGYDSAYDDAFCGGRRRDKRPRQPQASSQLSAV